MVLKVGFVGSSLSITWELLRNSKISNSTPNPIGQKLWGWGLEISVLSSPPGDYYAHSSLRTPPPPMICTWPSKLCAFVNLATQEGPSSRCEPERKPSLPTSVLGNLGRRSALNVATGSKVLSQKNRFDLVTPLLREPSVTPRCSWEKFQPFKVARVALLGLVTACLASLLSNHLLTSFS